LGDKLAITPEHAIFPGVPIPGEYMSEEILTPPANVFSEDYLKEKTTKIRQLIEGIKGLEREKKDLGL